MLKQRVITALIMLMVGVGFLFVLPERFIPLLALGLLAVMAWEWAGLTAMTRSIQRIGYVGVSFLSTILVWQGFPDVTHHLVWQLLTVLSILLVIFAVVIFARMGQWSSRMIALLRVFGVWWLGNFTLVLIALFEAQGAWWLLYAMSLVWIMDTGAYFSGKAFGRRKLAPLVSPGKTWEGVWGGLVLIFAYSALIAWWQLLPVMNMIIIALVVGGLSVAGDLFESAMKRQVNVKDSSQMLPGHGGWLDRFDALLLALPLFWLLSMVSVS